MRRNATFEFVVPTVQPPLFRSYRLFPLAELNRTPAKHVSVHSEDSVGRRLPQLTRHEERQIFARGYAFIATHFEDELPFSEDQMRNYILRRIDRLALASTVPAEPALPRSKVFTAIRGMFRRMEHVRTIFALIPDAEIALAPEEIHRICISHDEGYVMIRPSIFRTSTVLRYRRDPKLSLTAAWNLGQEQSLVLADSSGRQPKVVSGKKAEEVYRQLHRTRWWMPDTYCLTVPIDGYLDAMSYHAEAICPSGIYFDKARLRFLRSNGRISTTPTTFVPESTEMIVIEDDDCHADRTHLYFSSDLSQKGSPNSDYLGGKLDLVLRPTFHNGLRSGMWFSVLSSMTLWFLFSTKGWPAEGLHCWICNVKVGSSNNDAQVAFLLLVLSVALGLLVRQEEHHLTKLIQARYRMRLFVVAVLLFSTAVAIAINLQGHGLFWDLLMTSVLVTLITVPTITSSIYSKFRISKVSKKRPSP
jgi:hypothetical protein